MAMTASESFDQIIDGLRDQLFHSPEEQWFPLEFLRDPCAAFRVMWDRFGSVFRRDDAIELGFVAPNPFLLDESKPIFFVLGYDPAVRVWQQTQLFSHEAYATSAGLVFGPESLSMLDGEIHARYRALFQQGFKKSSVQRWGEQVIEPVTEHLVDRLARRGRGDLVRELAAPVPFKVMAAIFGLADEQLPYFFKLASDLLHIGYDAGAAFAARDELGAFLSKQIEERRVRPTDDLISDLVQAEVDGERLPEEVIIANLRQLLPAGIETTYRSTGNMFVHLLANRDQFEAVAADPALVGAAVEEALRIDGPAFMTPRMATRDTELDGVAIPAGSGVLASQAMANRDPARWDDPDRFDIHRPARPHVAFIAGAHSCLGLHIARLQMQTMLRHLAARMPDVRLAVDAAEVPSIGFMLRSPARCPVIADGAGLPGKASIP